MPFDGTSFQPAPRPRLFSYRRVGGIRFLALGRLRFSFCIARKPQA
jgi:hypothetical protein